MGTKNLIYSMKFPKKFYIELRYEIFGGIPIEVFILC